MKINSAILICFLLLLSGCKTTNEVMFASKQNNVCKVLRDKVIFYAIFVDSKYTKPWSEYDIKSALDSISKGMNWIMDKAVAEDIPLEIIIDYHRTPKGTIPIFRNLSKKTLSATLFRLPLYSGIRDLYRWADKIAAEAGKSFPDDTSYTVKTKNLLTDRERLIAKIRDLHKTDNVALFYFVNNYYQDELSVAIDTQSDRNVEFAVVSFKYPAVIVHEFLHLFGAWDLYITPFDQKKKNIRKKKIAMNYFPNEIMAFAYRNLETLEIGDLTKYLIGWHTVLSSEHSKLILGKKLKPAKY